MSETLRRIISDCVAGISVLFVLGVAFFVYELGLQHVYQELHELRTELSSVKQRNQELEKKIRVLEDGSHEETLSRQEDGEFDQPEIASAKFELSGEVQTLNEPDTCATNMYAKDLFDGVCIWESRQIKRPKSRRKNGVKYKGKLNSKRTPSYIIKRKSPRQICKNERQLKSVLTNFEVFCESIATCIAKQNVKAKRTAKWPKAVAKASCKAGSRLKQCKATKVYKLKSATNSKSTPKTELTRAFKRKTSVKPTRTCKSIINDFTPTIKKFKPSTKVKATSKFASRGKGFSKSGRKGRATSKSRGKHKATTKPATLVKSTSRSKIYTTPKKDTKVKTTSRHASKVKTSTKETTHFKPASKTRGTVKSSSSNAKTKSKMSAKPVKVNRVAAPKIRNTRTASQSVRKPQAPRRATVSHRRRG